MIEKRYSAYFDNTNLTDFFGIQRISGRDLGERDIETTTVPGMRGAYLSRINAPVREIEIDALFHVDSREKLRKEIESLNRILETDDERELVFSDEEDRIYYAVYAGGEDDEDSSDLPAGMMRGTLYFLCADPDKYGQEREKNFENGYAVIDVEGSLDTAPLIDLEVLEDVTFIQVVNQDTEYMQIGDPADVEETVIDPSPIVFETMGDFEGWTADSLKWPENGTVDGAFATEETVWFPSFYGEDEGWHGPGQRFDLPRLIQDFWVEMVCTFRVWRNQDVNNLELYLIDSDNEYMGKIKLKNESSNHKNVLIDIAVGGQENRHFITQDFQGFRRGSYTEFFGRVFIRRSGNEWWGQAGQRDEDGRYYNRSSDDRFQDVAGEHMKELSAIQVHAGAYKDRGDRSVIYVHSVTVREGNNPQINEIPLIAKEGDRLIFDHFTGEVLLNGDLMNDRRDFGSSFFSLKKGQNEIFLFPENAFSGTFTYQNKYK